MSARSVLPIAVALTLSAPAVLQAAEDPLPPAIRTISVVAVPEPATMAISHDGDNVAVLVPQAAGTALIVVGPSGKALRTPVPVDARQSPMQLLSFGDAWAVRERVEGAKATIVRRGRVQGTTSATDDVQVGYHKGKAVLVTSFAEDGGSGNRSGATYSMKGYDASARVIARGGFVVNEDGGTYEGGPRRATLLRLINGGLHALFIKDAAVPDGGQQLLIHELASKRTRSLQRGPATSRQDPSSDLALLSPPTDAFIRWDEKSKGFVLMGPLDAARPLHVGLEGLDPATLQQGDLAANEFVYSLSDENGWHFFHVDVAKAYAFPVGYVATDGEDTSFLWAASGGRLAILKATGSEAAISIFDVAPYTGATHRRQ